MIQSSSPTSKEMSIIKDENTPLTSLKEAKAKENTKNRIDNNRLDVITSVAVTPDNKFIISGSKDQSIKMFDIQTQKEVHCFSNAHQGPIISVTVTPNSQFIVSGSRDKSIKVFDIQTRQEVHHFQNADKTSISSLAVTPDNKFIVSGSSDGSMKIFDIQAKQEVYHFEDAHEGSISSIAITSDNKFIVSGSHDQLIKVFDLQTRQEVYQFPKADQILIYSLAVSSDSKFIISGYSDGSIKLFDFQTKQEVHHFQNAHQNIVTSIAVTSDNRFFISCSFDTSIKVFDLHTKQEVHHFQNAHLGPITSIALTPDNHFIISGSLDRALKVFDIHLELQVHCFEDAHRAAVISLAVSSDNKYLISGSRDNSMIIFDLQTKQEIHHFQDTHKDWISSVAITSDNRFIVSGSNDGSVKLFDFQAKQELHHFQDALQSPITSIILTPNNKFIISSSINGSIKVFDLQTKQQVYHFQNAHGGFISSLAITSDSKFIILGAHDKSIKIFDFQTKQEVYHFQNAHQNWITSVAITSDNKFIISASHDRSIKVFDFQTKQEVYHFQNAHSEWINSIAVTADNKFVISGSDDGFVKVFDLETRQQIHCFQSAYPGGIRSVAVTPDSQFVISGSSIRFIEIFKFQTKQEVDDLQSIGSSKSSAKLNPKIADLHAKQQEFESTKPLISFSPQESLISIQDPTIFNQEFYFISETRREFSVFNSVDHFLFDKSVESSISSALDHPGLFILPFRWTILHIMSVYSNSDFIARMPAYSQFKMPFLLDSFKCTPLHYLVAQKNVNFISVNIIFSYICDYLEDCYSSNPFEFQKITESLSSLLPLILEKIEIKSRQRFLLMAYSKSSAPYNNPIPIFGDILSESAFFCDSPVLIQETREKIWNAQGTSQVEFRSNYLQLDYDILSQDMEVIIDSLKKQKGEDIFKVPLVVRLIDHLWGQAETPLILFFGFYSAFIIALSVYLTFRDRSLPYEITLLVVAVLFTVNEFWQIFNLKKTYLSDLWNWLDLAHLLLTISFLVTRIADNDNELARAWISTIIIVLGYLRWISLLKIFKPTRNLIQVVITIMKEMVSFVIIIALIIIGFSLIFLVFNREDEYGDYLYQAYNVLYGPMDIEEGTPWSFSQKLIMAVLAFFLNVVLLNLLISIMGDSYGQVLEMRDRTDSLTRLEMISEAAIYRKFLKPHHQTKRGYLVYCLPVELEEDQDNELQNLVKVVKNLQKENEVFKESLNNKISNFQNYLQNEFSQLKTSLLENKK